MIKHSNRRRLLLLYLFFCTLAVGIAVTGAVAGQAQTPSTGKPNASATSANLADTLPIRLPSGIGGVFFRAQAPAQLAEWYKDKLGVSLTPMKATDLPWRQTAGPTAFGPLPPDKSSDLTEHGKTWMVRFRVHNLDAIVAQLRAGGVVVAAPQKHSHDGRIVRLHDPEDNPIELWEPKAHSNASDHTSHLQSTVESVDGIGGFFFLAQNPATLKTWYQDHFGLSASTTANNSTVWNQDAGPTAWTPFSMRSSYFGDKSKQWMIDFRVPNLAATVQHLREAGIPVTVDSTDYPYGKFARLNDPEGNPIELWQPHEPNGAP